METSLDPKQCGQLEEEEIVGGLLLRLSDNASDRRRAIVELSSHPAVTCGTPNGHWLPVAISAIDQRASRDLHHWLATIPGIDWVEVVSVFYSSAENAVPS
ncbi:MAG: hypothetical protein JNK85_06935 [Verrucomicrobiales bacterium]|nr:hypothetical protein [Verrucomicrobiales bacterium]